MKDEDLQIFEEAFQFLIGRLDTLFILFILFILTLFQFLIGRLDTLLRWKKSASVKSFNSS